MTSAFAPNSFGMDGHYGYMQPPPGAYFPEDDSPMISPDIYGPQLHQLNTISTESLHHQFADFDDPSLNLVSPVDGPSKGKRRQHGIDHVKHKRTRSGCYTCRQRRVKCDETHPICERCRKGKRDCIYPDPSSLKPVRDPSKIRSVPADSGSNTSGDEGDGPDSQRLPPILDEKDETGAGPASSEPSSAISGPAEGMQLPAHDSMSPSSKEKSPTSPADSVAKPIKRPQPNRQSSKQQLRQAQFSGPKWAKLPKDIRFYIKYHRDNITCNHYALKYDGTDFLKTTFLEIALGYEPLLYAIAAFSAYFHTLTLPNGKLSMFLRYYDRSVQTLRESLLKSARHSPATLLTILQLATFEEYLGDWVNVMSHQRAAHEILTQLFTPDNIMQNETRRKIISWYLRFDIVTGLISNNETVLGREWHHAVTEYYIRQEADRPTDLGCIFEAGFAKSRLLATDIALLFGRKGKGVITDEEFMTGLEELKQRVDQRDDEVSNAFADSRTYASDFPNAPPADQRGDDIVDSTGPDFLLSGDLWVWNVILVDWWAIKLVFLGQLYQLDKTVNPMTMVETSYKICRMFEAMEYGATEAQSAVLGAHASLGIAATTLPKDARHSLWCRKKFAVIERCGYVYPPSFRTRMSEMWSHDVTQWWLPDNELLLPILRSIRDFVDYRTINPDTSLSTSLREMSAIFEAMKVEEGDRRASSSTSASVAEGGAGEASGTRDGISGMGLGYGNIGSLEEGRGDGMDLIEEGSWGIGSSPDLDWGLVTSGEVVQGEWSVGGPSPERGM
ncbi:Fungal specific transcription factor domain-containing protein 76 [Elsinoe fawcettii]|nr:Fungal specific transcription factor domain-containing protein 76 [Elsinoe fawcettii]